MVGNASWNRWVGFGLSFSSTLQRHDCFCLQTSDSMFDLSDTGSVRSYGSYGSVSSLAMAQSGAPELLVSLCYQSLTGRLTVEVLKASNLRNVSMQRAPGLLPNQLHWRQCQ